MPSASKPTPRNKVMFSILPGHQKYCQSVYCMGWLTQGSEEGSFLGTCRCDPQTVPPQTEIMMVMIMMDENDTQMLRIL